MAISLEDTQQLTAIQARVVAGEAVPLAELKAAFIILRQGRKAAAAASTASKAAKAPVDTGSILAGLKDLASQVKSTPIK